MSAARRNHDVSARDQDTELPVTRIPEWDCSLAVQVDHQRQAKETQRDNPTELENQQPSSATFDPENPRVMLLVLRRAYEARRSRVGWTRRALADTEGTLW